MKKLFVYVVLATIFLNLAIPVVDASGIIVEDGDVSIENAATIEQLYDLRGRLALNFADNQTQIDLIDQQLERLGVQRVSAQYVQQKAENAIMANGMELQYCPEDSEDVIWTSERTIHVYYGRRFEVETVRGVPGSYNSRLLDEQTATITKHDEVVTAAWRSSIWATAGALASELIPGYGELCTVADIVSPLVFVSTQTVNFAAESATVSMNTTIIHRYVKFDGTADAGNQAICYFGSKVDYSAAVNYAYHYRVGDEFHSAVKGHYFSTSMESPYYSQDWSRHVCEHFYNYKMYGIEDSYAYSIRAITIEATLEDENGEGVHTSTFRVVPPL